MIATAVSPGFVSRSWCGPCLSVPLLGELESLVAIGAGDSEHVGRALRRRHLFEDFFRCDREAIEDFGGAVEHLKDMMAQRALYLARLSASRVEFDTAETRIAFGTDDVAFSHGRELCRRMVTVPRRLRFTSGGIALRVAIVLA